jgi:hypothetical protein
MLVLRKMRKHAYVAVEVLFTSCYETQMPAYEFS